MLTTPPRGNTPLLVRHCRLSGAVSAHRRRIGVWSSTSRPYVEYASARGSPQLSARHPGAGTPARPAGPVAGISARAPRPPPLSRRPPTRRPPLSAPPPARSPRRGLPTRRAGRPRLPASRPAPATAQRLPLAQGLPPPARPARLPASRPGAPPSALPLSRRATSALPAPRCLPASRPERPLRRPLAPARPSRAPRTRSLHARRPHPARPCLAHGVPALSAHCCVPAGPAPSRRSWKADAPMGASTFHDPRRPARRPRALWHSTGAHPSHARPAHTLLGVLGG